MYALTKKHGDPYEDESSWQLDINARNPEGEGDYYRKHRADHHGSDHWNVVSLEKAEESEDHSSCQIETDQLSPGLSRKCHEHVCRESEETSDSQEDVNLLKDVI